MPTLKGRDKGFPTGRAEWDGRRLVRTYTDQWQVHADNENQGPKQIIESVGVRIGEPFFDDVFAYAKHADARREEGNRLVWHVAIGYTSQFPLVDADEVLADTSPDNRRLKRRWSFETMQVAQTKDPITGDPIVNSANEPIEITEDITIPVLTVENYVASFSPTTILTYANHVNSAAFYGAPAKTALMAGIEAEEDAAEVYNGVLYDRVRYTVKFKIPVTEENKGWFHRVLDMGTIHRDPTDADNFVPYLSEEDATTGNRSQITGPLDGNGYRLPVGAPVEVLEFNKHDTVDFDNLSIGEND